MGYPHGDLPAAVRYICFFLGFLRLCFIFNENFTFEYEGFLRWNFQTKDYI
jgi:hypothetical protein